MKEDVESIRRAIVAVDRVVSKARVADYLTSDGFTDVVRVNALIEAQNIKLSPEAEHVAASIVSDYLFTSGFKRLMESTGTSRGLMFLHASALIVDEPGFCIR